MCTLQGLGSLLIDINLVETGWSELYRVLFYASYINLLELSGMLCTWVGFYIHRH